MSDAISPLKVLSLRENGTIEKVDKISDFVCVILDSHSYYYYYY